MNTMHLKILLPTQIFLQSFGVKRLIAETSAGSFGFLPNRLDCVATIVPGILTYESAAEGEVYLATDQGVLIKAGLDVLIMVRYATRGTNLIKLKEAVEQMFLQLDQREKEARSDLARMESRLFRRLHGVLS